MLTLLLYFAFAALGLLLAHRLVRPLSRWAALTLLLLPLTLTGHALLRGRVLGPIDLVYHSEPFSSARAEVGFEERSGGILTDVYSQMIPWRAAVRFALAHGEWPLWNPFMLCGDVLAASAQAAPYSPINLASLLLPLPQALGFCATAVLFFAALAAFLFARELGCGEPAALVAGAAFMFSGFVSFWLGWPHAAAVAPLPLVLLGVQRLVAAPDLRGLGILASAFILSLLAGHPETTVHAVLVGLLFAAYEWWAARPARPLETIAHALGAGLLAFAVTAVYLLPILDALPQSAEYGARKAHFAHVDRSLEPAQAAANLVPNFAPFVAGKPRLRSYRAPLDWYHPGTAWSGGPILALAAYALAASRRRERWFLLGLAIFGLLAGARAPGVQELLAALPLLDIALNERLVFAAAFALALLAALGLEAHAERARPRALAASFAATALALALLAAAISPRLGELGMPASFRWQGVAWVLAPLLAAALCALWVKRPVFLALLVLALTATERVVETRPFFASFPERMFYPRVAPLDLLPRQGNPYRFAGAGFNFLPNTGSLFGIEDPRGYNAMRLKRLVETFPLWTVEDGAWFNRIDDFDRPFLDFLNLRYALIPKGLPRPEGWERAGMNEGAILWRNPEALERAFVPERVRLGGARRFVEAEMAAETDFSRRAWLSSAAWPETFEPEGRKNGPGKVAVVERGTSYELTTEMERPGWVVVSVTAWKGWRAITNGEELPLAFANHAFVAFKAPAGRSTVELIYRPRSFVIGRAISLGTLALLALLGLVRGRPRGPS